MTLCVEQIYPIPETCGYPMGVYVERVYTWVPVQERDMPGSNG